MLRPVALTALIFAGALSSAQADVYRWVDEKGEAHYSDQWFPGAQVIKTDKAHPPGTDSGSRSSDQKSLAAANRHAATQASDQDNSKAVQEDVTKRREAVCKTAKDAYNRAITARRVYKDDKDGERNYMSDADADAYRDQLRKTVQDSCGSVPQFDPNAPIPEPQPAPEPKVNPADATSR